MVLTIMIASTLKTEIKPTTFTAKAYKKLLRKQIGAQVWPRHNK